MNKTIVLGLFFTLTATLHAQIGVETDPKTGKKGLIHPIEGYTIIPFLYEDVHPWGDDTLVTVRLKSPGNWWPPERALKRSTAPG